MEQTLQTIAALAEVYSSQDRHSEAESLYRELLEIRRRTLLKGFVTRRVRVDEAAPARVAPQVRGARTRCPALRGLGQARQGVGVGGQAAK